jgi:hypothetical protein
VFFFFAKSLRHRLPIFPKQPSHLTQAIFVFLLLSRYFYERQRLGLFIKNQHSLSERYQLSENVRSAQLLIPLMAFMSATSSAATTIFNLNSRLAPIEFRPIGIDLYFMLRVLQVLYIFHFCCCLVLYEKFYSNQSTNES